MDNKVIFKKKAQMTVECAGIEIPFDGSVNKYEKEILFFVGDKELPILFSGTELKIKIKYNDRTFTYHGTIFNSTNKLWQISNIQLWSDFERRLFFRQKISVNGSVCFLTDLKERNDKRKECTILDISAGGLKLLCPDMELKKGDQLYIENVTLVENKPPFSFSCKVVRIESNNKNKFYGCCFNAMLEKEREELIQAINQLQQIERRKKRLR